MSNRTPPASPGGNIYMVLFFGTSLAMAVLMAVSLVVPGITDTLVIGCWTAIMLVVLLRPVRWWTLLVTDPHVRSLTIRFLSITSAVLSFWVMFDHLWLSVPALLQGVLLVVLGLVSVVEEARPLGGSGTAEVGEQKRLTESVVDGDVLAVVDAQ